MPMRIALRPRNRQAPVSSTIKHEMCAAVEIRRIGSPCANRAGTTLRRAGWRHKLGNTGTDRSELPESINAGWKHEYPRNRASDYRAREDFHAYRHPRLPGQSRADQGEAEGL